MLKVLLGLVCLTAALGRWVNRPQQQRKKRNKRRRKQKKKGGGGGGMGEGHRCDQDVTTPVLVSGAALAGAGDGEPKHSRCLLLLSQRVAAR